MLQASAPLTNLAQLKKAVELLSLKETVVAPKNLEEARQRKFHFWETQPVPRFGRRLRSFFCAWINICKRLIR